MNNNLINFKTNEYINENIEKLKRHPKRLIFSEADDERVIKVALYIAKNKIGAPILIGNKKNISSKVRQLKENTLKLNIIEPETSSDFNLFCHRYSKLKKYQGYQVDNVEEIVSKPHIFSALMTQYGNSDAMIAGNQSTPASVFRSLLSVIKPLPSVKFASSVSLFVDSTSERINKPGKLFLADTGIIPEPTIDQIAHIAIESGKLAANILNQKIKIALLSYAPKTLLNEKDQNKISGACVIANNIVESEGLNFIIEGPIQADVAVSKDISLLKRNSSNIFGDANVLIFPNLHSGHITMKLLKFIGGFHFYGQFIVGLAKPAVQVSKAVSVESLLGTSLSAGVLSIKYHDLFPTGGLTEID